MNRKKIFYIFSLLLMTICTSVSGTFAYFNYQSNVKNNISVQAGSLKVAIQSTTGSGCSRINIFSGEGFVPGKTITKSINITNTGTLTEKLDIGWSNVWDPSNIGRYISCNTKVISDQSTLMAKEKIFNQMIMPSTINPNQPSGIQLVKDSDNQPILLAPNSAITLNFEFTLATSAPYSTENESIIFDFVVKATQPNDPSWERN